jgi:hypothetical protein
MVVVKYTICIEHGLGWDGTEQKGMVVFMIVVKPELA